jgi:hypothetical protein
MALMSVNNSNEQGKDHRSQPRWSAGKKTEAVLRLLRGEPLEELSRELGVEAHRLAPSPVGPATGRWWVRTRCMGRGEGHPKISVTYAAMDFSPSARLAATR